MKVVLDTNVLISGLIKTGKPRQLILKLVEKGARMVLSRDILEEFLGVASEPKIGKYVGEDDVIKYLKIIGGTATIIEVKSEFEVVEEDPDDDKVLRTAYDGEADYIVSGNGHLLSIGEFEGIEILTVTEMLNVIG